ncbi:MAG TPA: hypothetical protein PLB18_01630 [Acidobacteriota bacterium]|nr:hypothetical protein [Acidobacteriota bacterium]HNB71290.1 hypothetical protein [Acidobacteriota bacterium]HNC46960.1 hypothetical protein [Acidobacteriota bacterium]HND18043.1 hypothetical protein [Acidobacteriota bacterium]HNG92008.1 hypothetical protein [Acidobacteriota bacterium]
MTTFKDLDPIETDFGIPFIPVGWLEKDSVFETGPVSQEFFTKLEALVVHPWQPFHRLGVHFCELCQFDPPGFNAEVYIPFEGKLYMAPVGIKHYIAAHWYRPPQIFIEAVLACPPMRSMAYHKSLLENGARPLIKALANPPQMKP